jgi:hypothetical protein
MLLDIVTIMPGIDGENAVAGNDVILVAVSVTANTISM